MISMNLGSKNLKILSRFSREVISKPISPLSIEERIQNTRSNKKNFKSIDEAVMQNLIWFMIEAQCLVYSQA